MKSVKWPTEWTAKELSEVAEIERRGVHPSNIPSGSMYIGLEHMDNSGGFADVPTVQKGDLSSTKFVFDEDHILYGKLRPYLSKVSRPSFAGICSTDILPIRPSKQLDKNYLYYFLRQQSMISLATTRSSGANLPRISPKTLETFPIVFPPLSEQKRIAAILDKADAIRKKRKKAIELTETFLRSAFLEMFNPSTHQYPIRTIGNIGKVLGGKRLPKGTPYAKARTKHPYIRVVDFENLSVNKSSLKYIDDDVHKKISKYIISSDDVYISIAGTIGLAGTIPKDLNGANLTENAARITIYDPEITPGYLARFLMSDVGQSQINKRKMATSQPKLALFRIEEIEIPVPPITAQNEYLNLEEKISRKMGLWESANRNAANLFNSLVQRAFRGEL